MRVEVLSGRGSWMDLSYEKKKMFKALSPLLTIHSELNVLISFQSKTREKTNKQTKM